MKSLSTEQIVVFAGLGVLLLVAAFLCLKFEWQLIVAEQGLQFAERVRDAEIADLLTALFTALVALFALVVAIISLAVAIRQANQAHDHNIVSLTPSLTYLNRWSSKTLVFGGRERNLSTLKIDIRNCGPGLATIYKTELYLDDQLIGRPSAAVWDNVLIKLNVVRDGHHFSTDDNLTIGSDQTIPALDVDSFRSIDELKRAFSRIELVVFYRCLYGREYKESWTYDFEAEETIPSAVEESAEADAEREHAGE